MQIFRIKNHISHAVLVIGMLGSGAQYCRSHCASMECKFYKKIDFICIIQKKVVLLRQFFDFNPIKS